MITLNPVYQPIFNTDKRYILVTGGRGSSKSFSVSTASVLNSYEKGHLTLYSRYSMLTADDSIIPEVKDKIEKLGAERDFLIEKDRITNTGSRSSIIFRGIKTSSGDQTAKLKSIQGLTDWILDEAEELRDEKKFDDIDLSVRGNSAKNKIILILNPTTKDHWIWKRWFEKHLGYVEIDGHQIPVSKHPDVLHIHTTYLDNLEHLPKDFVMNILRMRRENPTKYKHKILGSWLEKAEGVIFENWSEGEFNTYLPYCFGLDFGFAPDPMGMIKVAVDRKRQEVYWQEKLYEKELSTKMAVKAVQRCIDRRNDLIMCDTSEPRLFAELRSAGLNVQMVSKKMRGNKGSIITDIRDLMDYKLIVDPYSFNAKMELNNYVWNDKKSDTPIDDYNHLIDPGRYAFRKLVGWGKSGGKGIKQMN